MRHLRYFQTIARAGSFTKAAAELRIAQPALSRQMQALEEEIGVDLFIRTSRGLNLTAEGKLFLAEADNLLRGADDAVLRTRALSRGDSGELHIGYLPTPTAEILSPALDLFQQTNPAVKVILREVTGDELTAGLLDGSLHLGVTVERMDEAALGLVFEELRRYRFCVVASRNHPLARRKSITVAEAAAQTLVGFRRGVYSTADVFLDQVFGPHHLRPAVAVECDSASSLFMELETGRGIAVLNEVYARQRESRLALIPFSDSEASHAVGITRARKRDITAAGEKFCESLRKTATPLSRRKVAAKQTTRNSKAK